ncbi:hypothetical protein [Nonomuraea sp. NPDC049400]|uniref:hypothetical protein n=1 Tax=Nonomuraea sp. NPDC049400 TaxID=3364352 RepID=UPI00379F1338
MSEINVSPWQVFTIKVRMVSRLLSILAGGSVLALGAANAGTAVGAIVATAIGLLTTAGIYSGQRLAAWLVQQEIARPRSKPVTSCDCRQ